MKKAIISIVIIILLTTIYVTASWYVGNVIRDNIENSVELLSQQANSSQDEVKITISYKDYQQNIFSTQLRLVITVLNQDGENSTLFNDNITIYHGPFPLAALSHGQFIPQLAWVDYAMPQEVSPQLWRLAGNKPFITGSLSINFQQYITLKLVNVPVDNLPETMNINGYHVNQLAFSRGELTVTNNKNVNDLSFNLTLDKFKSMIDSETVSFDGIKLSVTENQDNSGFSYILSMNDLLYQVENSNEAPKISLNKIGINGDLYKNQNYDLNLTIDKLIYAPDINATSFVINKFLLNQKSLPNGKSGIFNGELTSSVESLRYGEQNLGNGDIHLTYKELDNELISKSTSDFFNATPYLSSDRDDSNNRGNSSSNNDDDKLIVLLSLDKLNWYNQIGKMSVSAKASLFNNYLDMDSIDINNIISFKLNVDIPFTVLSQMAAQINNPTSTEVTSEQLNDTNQSMQVLAMVLSRPIPIFEFSRADVEGIYSNLIYSKKDKHVQINGKTMDKDKFLALFHH